MIFPFPQYPHAANGSNQNPASFQGGGHINPLHSQQPPQQRLSNGLMSGGGGGGESGDVMFHGGGHLALAEVTV